jgi:division protein CdvB (Snf7/Vps24/ESCRT-III family)
MELKQRAKVTNNSNDPALKTLAKQLVQVRQQRGKLQSAKAQIGAMGMHATVAASQIAAASAIGSVTTAMASANKAIDTKQMMATMADFQKENERAAMKQEMMDDVLMDIFDSEGADDEAEQVTNQVLAELGVELDSQMVGLNAPQGKPANADMEMTKEEQEALDDVLPGLKARLNAL